ncbi:MAG: YbdK family carboxylate-amine ligase, partial [Leifsonia sp.]
REALQRDGGHDGAVMKEFFPSQLEFASPVCTSAAEVLASLSGFRAELSSWASGRDLLPAGVGLPYRVDPDAHVTDTERYRDIASHFGLIVSDHQINGLHVHVGVPDREAAARASNRLSPWLPALLALSANSPYWQGADTGFDSWRAIHSRRWTTHGIPLVFRGEADYDLRTAALKGVGGTTDAGTLNWVVRPSERYPTVEVRVFDAQLDAETSAALAALVRGLGVSPPTKDAQRTPAEPELLDSALWHAARNGLGSDLLDPSGRRLRPAPEVVHALRNEAAAGLTEHGEVELVGAVVERILSEGNGATRQRRALARGGTRGLADLIRSGCARGTARAG